MTYRFSLPIQGARLGLAALFTTVLGLSSALANDQGTYIESVNRSSGLTGEAPREETSKTYVAHDKMKVVSSDPQGAEMILDPATGDMTFLNNAEKEYYQINAKGLAEGMSQPGMEQMRTMMEQTKVTVEPTDETKKINDWNCRKYKVTKKGMVEVEQEIWATEDVKLDLKRYTDLMSMSGPEGLLGNSEAGQAQRAEMEKVKGYPILSKSKMQLMGSTMETESEVKVIRQEPMPAEMFEIPADYKKKEMGEPKADAAHP